MKKTGFSKEITRKSTLIGAVGGFILFTVVGLFPSSFIGGVIGLEIAKYFLGSSLSTELLARSIVGISMVIGIITAGLTFIIGASFIGWLFGYVVQSLKVKTIPKTA